MKSSKWKEMKSRNNHKNNNNHVKKINKKRQAYVEKQEKQGQKVVLWIMVALIILALAYAFYFITVMN